MTSTADTARGNANLTSNAISIETRDLVKDFGSSRSVDHVSLQIKPGRIHAILGENGAGKSTLMKLLFGLHQPTAGQILINGRSVVWRSAMDAIEAGLGMVQQHFTLVETLSAIDNILLGAEKFDGFGRLDRAGAIAEMKTLLPDTTVLGSGVASSSVSSLEIPWMELAGDLPIGQQQRLEILKLLYRRSKVLFLDEPTAVLTPQEVSDLFQALRVLREQGKSIVLITHKIHEVLSLCDDFSVLRQGRLVGSGLVSETSIDEIVRMMMGADRALEISRRDLRPESSRSGNASRSDESVRTSKIECIDLRDADQKLNRMNLRVREGEVVGIAGVEGAGQSQLVEVLMGLRPFAGGQVRLDQFALSGDGDEVRAVRGRNVGLIPEDRHVQALWMDASCFENLSLGHEADFTRAGVLQSSVLRKTVKQWSLLFDVRASSLDVPVRSLSGGNQQKLIFAREIESRRPKVLICHQPTRGVDLGAIDLIHRQILKLANEGAAVLVLSSELDELMSLSDRIVVMNSGRNVLELERAQFDRVVIGRAMVQS